MLRCGVLYFTMSDMRSILVRAFGRPPPGSRGGGGGSALRPYLG